MATEIKLDPYTLVAHHLQEGEATRAELKVLTELEYAPIQAALERFHIMSNLETRIDGMGVEHYRWKGDAYEPEVVTPRPVLAHPKPERLPVEQNPGVNKNGRPAGWSLSAVIREYIDTMDQGVQFSMPTVYDWLIAKFPKACETYTSTDLRTQISAITGQMVGKTISRAGESEDRKVNLYTKGISPAPAQAKPAKAIKQSTVKVSAKLPYKKREQVAPEKIAPAQKVERGFLALDLSYQVVIRDLENERDEIHRLILFLRKRYETSPAFRGREAQTITNNGQA